MLDGLRDVDDVIHGIPKLVTRNYNRVLLDQYKCLGFKGFVVNGLFFKSIMYPVRALGLSFDRLGPPHPNWTLFSGGR